ncbi:class B sortase [Paenibacillus daejeonensis]|uniref:class B sortase n=1 Tax=Paenibacillus daejeonensis TaxID=135193 RepID=UPI000373ECCE|nr:class B sortase [Paenibacillus daejeonensis]
MGNKLRNAVLFILVALFLYSGCQLALYLYDGYKSNQLNERMRQQVETDPHTSFGNGGEEQAELTAEQVKQQYQARFHRLHEINSDIVGWLRIDHTPIDYPVLQSDDNDYYLKHNVDKQASRRGSIFMDYRNTSITDDIHTVIYGHHMKDGSMFGELAKYKDAAYYREHPTITFEGIEEATAWEIFSVYIYSPDDQFFEYEFADQQHYDAYLQKIIEQSHYATGVSVTSDDQLLTLVTCTYEVTDARFIIHAKRVL